ncbi:hypothetical protein PBCVOR070422_786L [Paramecium bursaria Chlorella virus OR0704.2.2]|nr:hypothetical protein PBCVOR070422_786L [Paramecium bursaria Chlorella virus OR0704.2.2]
MGFLKALVIALTLLIPKSLAQESFSPDVYSPSADISQSLDYPVDDFEYVPEEGLIESPPIEDPVESPPADNPPANVDQDNQTSCSVPIGIIVGGCVGGILLIDFIIFGIQWCKKHRKKHRKNRMDPALDYNDNTAFGSPHAYITPTPVVASARVEQDQVISGSGHTVMNIV